MKHIKEFNEYDFLGQRAAELGMTREEYIAIHGTYNSQVDENCNVLVYENYMTYKDFEKSGKWGSPEDIKADIKKTIEGLFKYGGLDKNIKKIEFNDQSTDDGIKFEVLIDSKNTIHLYKNSRYRGEYEVYLNKKKSSLPEIQEYFLDMYLSDLDKYLASMDSFDYHYQRSDDSRAYKAGGEHRKLLIDMFSKLSNSDKKKATKEFAKKHNVKEISKDFVGT